MLHEFWADSLPTSLLYISILLETALVSRLSASGSIPAQWLQAIRKALEDQDWRLAQGSLESLLEPPEPRPQSRVRQPLQPPSVYGCGADMGIRLISGIHGHRIHCTGLRWERVDAPPSKGRQIYNRALARLLRRGPSSILEDGEWRSLGLEPPYEDSFVRPRADEPTHFRPIPEDARETRFLCSINAPTQIRIQALIDMWDHGQHIAFREEIIKGRDLIPLPPSWCLRYRALGATAGGCRLWTPLRLLDAKGAWVWSRLRS